MTNIVTDNIDSESLIVMLVALLNDELEVVPVQLWLVQDVVKDTFSFIASQLSGKINRKIGWEYSLFLPQLPQPVKNGLPGKCPDRPQSIKDKYVRLILATDRIMC